MTSEKSLQSMGSRKSSQQLERSFDQDRDVDDGDVKTSEREDSNAIYDRSQGHENDASVEEESQVERTASIELPYVPPKIHFIRIVDRDGNKILANSLCRKGAFLDFLRKKMDMDTFPTIDNDDSFDADWAVMLDFIALEEPVITDFRCLAKHVYIESKLAGGGTYLPCWLFVDDEGYIKRINPILNDCPTQFPCIAKFIEEAQASELDRYERTMAMHRKQERIAALAAARAEREKEEEIKVEKKKKK